MSMRVLALGHSCYLLEMSPADGGEPVRILADPWLEDYLIGDLLGRFPRVRLATSRLPRIDGIYLSHSHTDHLDPYSLLLLWRELEPRPTLLLPQSLRFLEALVKEYLEGVEITFLQDSEPVDFHGLSLMGLFNPETGATNEDDVMVLVARNGCEVFLAESDALLPFYHPEGRELVSSLLLQDDARTICFLTTKNEGEATTSSMSARDAADRLERVERSVARTYEEINDLYIPHDELDDELWSHRHLVRLIGGQGICFPQDLDTSWNRVLFPIRLRDRVHMEREVAEQYDCQHAVEEFVAGRWHTLGEGRLIDRIDESAVELLDREEERDFDRSIEVVEDFLDAPLSRDERDEGQQREKILECLNQRFLPHLIGARNPPVEHILGRAAGEYRLRVRYGTDTGYREQDYRITFERLVFEAVPLAGDAAEAYWANDLEDFLAGRCDEFSTFIRHPLPAKAQRLWLCLGLPYLNNDLIEKKLRLHFERASRGESIEDWVLSFWP